MEDHREISRAGGESTTEQLAAEIVGAGTRPSEFVGYEKTDVLTAVIAVGPAAGTRQLVKLEQSPFYAAGGGQVSDSGYLLVDGSETKLDVVEVLKFGDDQVLAVETGGEALLAEGTRVRAVVEWAARFPTMANHTATHLLHAALREVLGDHVKQAGSAVRPDKLRFDFSHSQPLTRRGARAGRAAREREGVRGDPRAHVRDADRGGAQARRDDALRREVRQRGARRRDRRLLARALRRHARSLDRRDRPVRDHVGEARSAPARAGSRPSPRARRGRSCTAARASSTRRAPSSSRPAARRRSRRKAEQTVDVEPDVAVVGGTQRDRDGGARASAPTRCSTSPTASSSGARLRRSCSARARTAPCTWSPTSTRASRSGSRPGDVVKEIAPIVGGGGGGRPTMARAGGKNPDGLDDALARARELIAARPRHEGARARLRLRPNRDRRLRPDRHRRPAGRRRREGAAPRPGSSGSLDGDPRARSPSAS